jgi:solute carrier family 44 (choline transporter-like protein), member 2/4/5
VLCFITAFGEMVLAATFATWYWTFTKTKVPVFTLTRGLGRTIRLGLLLSTVYLLYVIILITFNFRFNLGTLAYGSLIIAICQIIRAIIEYVNHKLKKYDNEVTRAIMCMFRCLFWCLEKFLRFVNRNGNYIYHQENP